MYNMQFLQNSQIFFEENKFIILENFFCINKEEEEDMKENVND